MSSDWLPGTIAVRLAMAQRWADEFDGPGIAGVDAHYAAQMRAFYKAARAAYNENRSARRGPVTTAALRAAMAKLIAFMRRVKRDRLSHSKVSDVDLTQLGLHPRRTAPKTVPVPVSVSEIETGTAVIRELVFRLRNFGAIRWARPAHARGFEFVWAIRDARPQHVGGLTNLIFATRNPVVVAFDESERGKRVFFAVRWVGSALRPGPWSDIESAVIP